MAKRFILKGERHKDKSKRHKKKKKKKISLFRAIQGFFAEVILNASIATVVYIINPRIILEPMGPLELRRGRSNGCYGVFRVIPEHMETATVCVASNLSFFMILPTVVLVFILYRFVRGRF